MRKTDNFKEKRQGKVRALDPGDYSGNARDEKNLFYFFNSN